MFVEKAKTVMLFGSFDGIHPGHEFLINSALHYGSKIIIVVAQDSVIEKIKKQKPIHKLNIRMNHLSKRFPEAIVVVGDMEQNTWSAVKKYRPNTILVGYDQNGLYDALQNIKNTYAFKLAQSDSFFPEKYKSSLIRK